MGNPNMCLVKPCDQWFLNKSPFSDQNLPKVNQIEICTLNSIYIKDGGNVGSTKELK